MSVWTTRETVRSTERELTSIERACQMQTSTESGHGCISWHRKRHQAHGSKREFLNFRRSFLNEDHRLCFLLDPLEVGDLKSSKHQEQLNSSELRVWDLAQSMGKSRAESR